MNKYKIDELKKAIGARAISLIAERVSLTARGGEHWGNCPFHAEKTASFAVKMKDGEVVWHCQGCKSGGDILNFLEKFDHIPFLEAVNLLARLAGDNQKWHKEAEKVEKTFQEIRSDTEKKSISLSDWKAAEQALAKNSVALAWLETTRGISVETAHMLHLGFAQAHKFSIHKEEQEIVRDKGWILFPRIEGEKVVSVKLRSIVEKCFTQMPGMSGRALFNIETVNALEPVFVVEGELDACIMEQAGYRAVSLPSAGATLTPEQKRVLKTASEIFLAGDTDSTGADSMRKLARELGSNTYWLKWPDVKDANDYFREICRRSKEEFYTNVQRLMAKARATPIEGFCSLLERLGAMKEMDMSEDPRRLHHPIASIDHMAYNPPGSVVIFYSSYSGTGKSMYKSQVLVHEATRGEVVVDYSPEITGDEYLALITSQVLGEEIPGGLPRSGKISREHFVRTKVKLNKPTERGTEFRYYVGHTLPCSSNEEVVAFLESTIQNTGCTRFAIDTFHRIVFPEGGQSQVEAEGVMIKQLEALGNKYGVIFLLICQSNKEAEGVQLTRKDELGILRGSREMMDIPSSIYLLHRKRVPQRDGSEPKDLLELNAWMLLRKDRYKGTGAPQVKLLLKPEWSKFVPLAYESSRQKAEPASVLEDEFSY